MHLCISAYFNFENFEISKNACVHSDCRCLLYSNVGCLHQYSNMKRKKYAFCPALLPFALFPGEKFSHCPWNSLLF